MACHVMNSSTNRLIQVRITFDGGMTVCSVSYMTLYLFSVILAALRNRGDDLGFDGATAVSKG